MTATGHALIATLIIAKIPNPYISLPLVFASHFVLDMVPHWDVGTHHRKKTRQRLISECVADVLVSIVSSFLLYHWILGQSNYVLLYSGVFIAQLPDWVMAPYAILGWRGSQVGWSKWMYKLQSKMNVRLDKPWGVVTQVVSVVGLYILLFKIF